MLTVIIQMVLRVSYSDERKQMGTSSSKIIEKLKHT